MAASDSGAEDVDSGDELAAQAVHSVTRRKRTLAERLWPGLLRSIVRDPRKTAVLWASVNSVFVGLGELIAGICALVSTPGFFLLLCGAFYALVYNVTRAITYPGFISNVKRSLEKDIAKEVRRNTVRYLACYQRVVHLIGTLAKSEGKINQGAQTVTRSHLLMLHAKATEARRAVLEPLLETLTRARTAAGSRSLDYGGDELISALECLFASDDCFQEYVMGPLLNSLASGDAHAYTAALAGPISALSFPAEQLLEDDVMLMTPSHTRRELDAAQAKLNIRENPAIALDSLVFYLRRTLCLAANLEEQALSEPALGVPPGAGLVASESDVNDQEIELDTIESGQVGLELDEEGEQQASTKPSGLMWTIRRTWNDYRAAKLPMRAIATIDFLRTDMEHRCQGIQRWIPMSDGTRVDSMLLPGRQVQNPAGNKTILFCNPNCGIYEFAMYQCQWASFYTQRGYNVLLFNYRGYGRSQGWPSPKRLRQDGETIVRFIQSEFGVASGDIGVHAESIGGVVATHLARHADTLGISYLVADRTLCDLPATAGQLVGKWAGKIVANIGGWEANNVEGMLAAPSALHRLCTCDPNDEIIANPASLKCGIARTLINVACATDDGLSGRFTQAELERVQNLARLHVGPPQSFSGWVLDVFFYERFAAACVELAEAQRKLSTGGLRMPGPLAHGITDVVKLIWFADGRCGQALGSALAEYYGLWKHDGATGPATDAAVATERTAALRDWVLCFLVWGKVAPPFSALVDTQTRASRSTPFKLGGLHGTCGPNNLVELSVVSRAISGFSSQFAAALDQTGLSPSLSAVCSGLAALATASERQMPDATHPSEKIRLLPLSCGHNGRMNQLEEAVVVDHLRRAGWEAAV